MRFFLILFFIFFIRIFPQEVIQYELDAIEFEGNKEFSSAELQTAIFSEESPGWFYKFLNSFTPLGAPPVYFDSTSIQIDLQALQSFYNANGYFESKFSYKYEVDTLDKDVTLIYIIEEKEVSTYGSVKLLGFEQVPADVIGFTNQEMRLSPIDKYKEENIQLRIENVMTILNNQGYVYAEFDSIIVIKDTVKNKANMSFYFTPGDRYSIDSIVVKKDGEGADEVEDQLLRDLTGLYVGDLVNMDKVRRSQVRLYRSSLFSSVSFSPPDRDSVTSTRIPLIIEGTIGLMNELSPEIIMNNQQQAFNIGLGASYIRKNFLGDARKLTVKSSFGIQDIFTVDFSHLIKKFSFRDTTLLGYFDSRIILEQPFQYRRPIYATLENYITIDKQTNFNTTRYGSKLSLEFELARYVFLNFLKVSYNVEASNEYYRTLNDSLDRKLLSAIGAEFGSTTVDNIVFPTKGYNLSFQLEEANSLPYLIAKLVNTSYDDALFYKVVVTNTVFGSFGKIRNYIFASKLKIGHLQAFVGDYGGLPLNRTFYAGGSNSVRGWRANELVPKGTPNVPGFLANGVNVKGGTFLLEGTLESRLRFIESLGAAVFLDYGNTWLGYDEFRFDEVAVAAGFGLRYYSPVAPFRIDFGFKLYDPEDKRWLFDKKVWDNFEFHFGIGEAF
ncbi:MAG TPA: BamA/TamA family outer membrane protein [Ignavibacteriaceae bacterium]|nr:BamA/TamA family outer membrane protein [Ignavibacteriaceae bacterium]